MSLHIFGAIVTGPGVAANNRGETEGNITTLQKLLWNGEVHTTISAEAIRWAIRYYWQNNAEDSVNRMWDDTREDHTWQDPTWKGWMTPDGDTYIDDDLLGYMKAEGGKTEGEKGRTDKRRGVLEIARAVSTTPFAGDITFNARSGVKDRTSLYGTEMHATRYQYGFALTPERLRVRRRAIDAIEAFVNLGEVAGNHSRFLFDFSPESIVFRLTDDPAPRLLYCFEEDDGGRILAPLLVHRIKNLDIDESEVFIGGLLAKDDQIKNLKRLNLYPGIKQAAKAFVKSVKSKLRV